MWTRPPRWRLAVGAAGVALAAIGCASSQGALSAECEEVGRSSTPAPDHVDAPTNVRVAVEELVDDEPIAEDMSAEPDPEELRASWRAERIEQAGGVIERDAGTGRLLHRFDAIVVRWDEPRFDEANVFFLEVDGDPVASFDTNDEFDVWGVEPAPHEMTFVIERADLLRAPPGASWTLTSGWAHDGWYLPAPCGADAVRSAPVVLELPDLAP